MELTVHRFFVSHSFALTSKALTDLHCMTELPGLGTGGTQTHTSTNMSHEHPEMCRNILKGVWSLLISK